jgi:hypothetical protein
VTYRFHMMTQKTSGPSLQYITENQKYPHQCKKLRVLVLLSTAPHCCMMCSKDALKFWRSLSSKMGAQYSALTFSTPIQDHLLSIEIKTVHRGHTRLMMLMTYYSKEFYFYRMDFRQTGLR